MAAIVSLPPCVNYPWFPSPHSSPADTNYSFDGSSVELLMEKIKHVYLVPYSPCPHSGHKNDENKHGGDVFVVIMCTDEDNVPLPNEISKKMR